jgi:hypothetical protein
MDPASPNDPNRPRAVPPPLPVQPQITGWVTVATFPSHAQWHSARTVLSRHGIAAQMRTLDGDSTGVELLVMHTEAEWARDLLATGDEGPSDQATGGFPLHEAVITPSSPDQLRAIPVQTRLSESQQANYSAVLVVLWILLAVIVILMVMLML